jgi:hypothetical protein
MRGTVASVNERDQRNIEGIAKAYEAAGLHGGVVVQHACQYGRLIGNQSHGLTGQPAEPTDNVSGEGGMHFHEFRAVENAVDERVHIIRFLRVVGNQIIKRGNLTVGRIQKIQKRRLLIMV